MRSFKSSLREDLKNKAFALAFIEEAFESHSGDAEDNNYLLDVLNLVIDVWTT